MPPKRRRAYGEGSISRNGRGLWVGTLEAGTTYDADGTAKRRRLTKASREHAVVVQWMAATKADLQRYGRTADPTITVQAWAERWLTEICAPKLRPTSLVTYRGNVRKWITPIIGRKRLARLTPADVRAVLQAVRDGGMTSSTARAVYTTLSALLESARREGLLTESVAGRVTPPPLTPSSRGALTAQQARTVLTAAAQMPGGSRYITLLLTGMRHAEMLGLTWECVDLQRGQLTVAWQLKTVQRSHGCGKQVSRRWPCGYVLASRCSNPTAVMPDGMPYRLLSKSFALMPPKSHKPRTVPLLAPLAAALARHRDDTAEQPNPFGLVWHTPAGMPLEGDADRKQWVALMQRCGLPAAVTPHWARHSVATLLMEAGVDVRIIGEIVGHASASVTAGYVHVSSDQARLGMGKLGELISG